MKFLWFTISTCFYIRWRFRRLKGLCSDALIYKTPLILLIGPLSLSRLIRYIALWFCFYMKFHDFTILENAFYGREARFEIKKIKNTLQNRLLLKKQWFFFYYEFFKIVKKPQWFSSKIALGNAWNRIVVIRTLVCWKKRR